MAKSGLRMEPARPLSYARWFARRSYRADLRLLFAELLAINSQHVTHRMSQIMCGSNGGEARQNLGPLMPERRRSDAVLVGFPCTAKYPQQLLYTLRNAVFMNPIFEIRVRDYCHDRHILVQLLILIVAASAPGLHERLRHALLRCIAIFTILSIQHSAAWAPHSLLPLGSTGVLSSNVRWRIAVTHYIWHALTILRPDCSSNQWACWPLSSYVQARRVYFYMHSRRAFSEAGQRGAWLAVTGGPLADSMMRSGADVIYTSKGRHTLVFSLKLPHVEMGSSARFEQVAARVMAAVTSALASYNADAAAILPDDPFQGAIGARANRQPLALESLACVEGCVHVLMVMSMLGGPGGGNRCALIHHQDVQVMDGDGDLDKVGLKVAVRQLIDGTATAISTGAEALLDGWATSVPDVLMWPPALPRSAEGEGGRVVAVALPRQSLEGLSAVRCVVVGPMGHGGDIAHVDEELRLWSDEADEDSSRNVEGYLILRLALPESALRSRGELYLHVLPPRNHQHLLGGSSSTSADAGGEDPPALLVSQPLLVLAKDAVQEVRQLYSEVLSDEAMQYLEGITSLDGSKGSSNISDGDGGEGGGGGGEGPSQGRQADSPQLATSLAAVLLAAAATEMSTSGLMGLIYDMGYLLRFGQDAGGEQMAAAAGAEVSFTESSVQPPPDPSFVEYVINFLSSRGMQSCAREVQGAMDKMQQAMPSCGREQMAQEPAGDMAAGGEGNGGHGHQTVPGGPVAALEGGAAFNGVNVTDRAAMATTADSGGSNGPRSLPLAARAAVVTWWLRALLIGFPSLDAEESYQNYKAAQCSKLDRMAMVADAIIRSCSIIRTGALSGAGAVGVTARLPQQQELLVLLLWLSPYLLGNGLTMRPNDPSGRRRNALLVLRGYLDLAVYALILIPMPGGGSLLPVPEACIVANRRRGMHWIYVSCWQPAIVQVSAYLQARLALISALPLLALSQHCLGSWTQAAVFAVGNILISTAVAALTDLPLRRRFMRQQQAATRHATPSGCGR